MLLIVSMAGCMRHEYIVGKGAHKGGNPAYHHWEHHFLFGLIGQGYVDVKGICPSGNARILERQTFLNGLVRYLALGMYNPTTVDVFCGDDSTAKVELSAAQVRAIAESPEVVAWAETFDPALAQRLAQAQRGAADSLIARTQFRVVESR